MLNLTTGQQTALEGRYTGMTVFMSLAFTSGTIRVSTWNIDLVWGGFTWSGMGNLAHIQEIKDTEKLEASPIDASLNVSNATLLSLAITSAEAYRGKAAIIYLGPMTDGVLVGTPIMCWTGYMDVMAVQYNADGTGLISVRCKPLTDKLNRPSGLRASHEQQKLILSTDLGFEYQNSLITDPQLWLSKKFQHAD